MNLLEKTCLYKLIKAAGKNDGGGYAVLYGPNGEKEEIIAKGKGPVMVRTYQDETGNIKTERKGMTPDELEQFRKELAGKAIKTVNITPETKLPVNEENLKADKI